MKAPRRTEPNPSVDRRNLGEVGWNLEIPPATLPPSPHVGTCRAELQSDRTGLKEEWGLRMRRLLPSRVEVAIFATLAVLCAALVGAFAPKTYDLRFAAFAGPIFLVAAVMGLRRNPAFQVVDVEDEDAVE